MQFNKYTPMQDFALFCLGSIFLYMWNVEVYHVKVIKEKCKGFTK